MNKRLKQIVGRMNLSTAKAKNMAVMTCVIGVSLISGLVIGIANGKKENKELADRYENKITEIVSYYDFKDKKNKAYEELYTDAKNDLNIKKMEIEQKDNQINWYKENVALAKNLRSSANRGDSGDLKLNQDFAVTTDEMNKWLDKKAPKDSPFRGQGKIFIEASKESGLDPMYIATHAGLESAWGTSEIAREKNNYFGIAAFNASPMESAKTFGSGLEAGIVEGACWIAKHYTNKGQDTLNKMLDEKNAYAQTDDGKPLMSWLDQMTNIYD